MILEKSSYFLLGIKGSAMSTIAVMLKQLGKKVSGVDVSEEFITDSSLFQNAIPVTADFSDLTILTDCDVFVYSAAHGGETSELGLEAKKRGILIVSQAQLIAEFVQKYKYSIAVAGCHGKTTTSSLLTYALTKLGQNPGFLIGAPPFEGGGGGKMTASDYCVVEADEYGVHPPKDKTPKLLFLHPALTLCLNIDFDHPDVYDTIEMTKLTFKQFFTQSQKCIVCADDPVIRSLLPSIKHLRPRTYGTTDDCDYQITNSQIGKNGVSFELLKYGKSQGMFSSLLYGKKNMLNCAGAVAILFEIGFTAHEIQTALEGFSGAKRRMETVWTDKTSYLLDDYAHHPAEIAATIAALRSRFPRKKLHILFQPHTYSRTEKLKEGFVRELALADAVYLLPIFGSARENAAEFHITSSELSRSAMHKGINTILAFDEKESLLSYLKKLWRKGDIVITLGAGDVYKLKSDIINILNEKST